MITFERIQKRMAEEIKQSGMTQAEIAKALNISQRNLSNYIHGDRMPSLDTLANLCKLLDLDVNYILCQD